MDEFDERQQQVRRQGYTYACWIMIALLFLVIIQKAFTQRDLYPSQVALAEIILIITGTFLTVYFILKDAYTSPKEGKHGLFFFSFFWLFLGGFYLWTLWNLIKVTGFVITKEKTGFEDPIFVLLMATYGLSVGCTGLYKYFKNRQEK